jgi:hypothetical protein
MSFDLAAIPFYYCYLLAKCLFVSPVQRCNQLLYFASCRTNIWRPSELFSTTHRRQSRALVDRVVSLLSVVRFAVGPGCARPDTVHAVTPLVRGTAASAERETGLIMMELIY